MKQLDHKKRPLSQRSEHQHSLCCGCRLSVSSSEEPDSASSSSRHLSVSSLAHAMVQERLDQMIKDMKPSSSRRQPRTSGSSTKFVLIVAMERPPSADPGEDFRESMVDVITANRIDEARDLRRLLEYYVSVNTEEYRCVILEAFYEVCSRLFLCKAHEYRSAVR